MLPLVTSVCTTALGCVAIIYVARYLEISRRQLRSYPLPPGPPGLPWVGNIIGMDAKTPWLTYSKWAKEYGDLIYTKLLGKEIVIIDSETVARDLLERRSRNYSDRPYLVTNECCGLDFNSGMLPYGDTWRLHRRFFHQTFRKEALSRFYPLQFRKSCRLLQRLLDTPDQFSNHVFDFTTSLIMNSVYDYDPISRQDELTEIVARVLEVISSTTEPKVALVVEAFPLLLRLPAWIPGMSFKTNIARAKEFASQYVEEPFKYSVRKLPDGASGPAMIHDAIRNARQGGTVIDQVWMKELKGAAASAFLGGSETANSVLMIFLFVMVLNPKVQEKAQTQIDLVLGGNRLPTIDDRPSLPYIDAILREVYRYHPVVPLSLPHMVLDDDVYSGFHIPKGALLFTNLWSMAHDESKFPNPEKFVPERFLAEDGSLLPDDTAHLAFGFGRRICPGRHFADTSLWSAISSVLAEFHVSKAKDASGVEIPVELKFSNGLSACPDSFTCSIVPRRPGMNAQKLEELIAATTAIEG